MSTEATLLQDLAVVCTASGAFALVFYYLKMPLLLGYMVGGFVVGPQFFGSWIHGAESIEQLSELGVIFLMFYIGLEFDMMKLKKIFLPSAFWLTFQTIGMVAIGMMIAPLLGWSGLNGIFFGSMLVMSSTMITIPLLKGHNALNTEYGQCAIGCLILEDILAIVFLVILSSIAGTGKLDLFELRNTSLVIAMFIATVFFVGRLIAPFFARALFRSSCAEVFVVAVVGFMMATCLLAYKLHFSVALGAFLAGSILSQTHIAEQVDKITEPLRDVFNAIFFTSVGMMINLQAIIRFWPWILALSIITFFGQTLIGTVALFLFGKRAETSFKAAFSKAQIGEFSFVIAILGNSLGVLHENFVSISVSVAVGTIVICSLLSNKMDKIFQFFYSKTPKFAKEFGKIYHNLLGEIKDNVSKNSFLRLTLRQLLMAIFWFLLLGGILFSVSWVASLTRSGHFNEIFSATLKMLEKSMRIFGKARYDQLNDIQIMEISSSIFQVFIWTAAFLVCVPFLVGITKSVQNIFEILLKDALTSRTQNELLNKRVFGVIKAVFSIVALFLFSGIFLAIASRFLPHGVPIVLFGTISLILAISLWKQLSKLNNRLELAFIESFNTKIETQDQLNRKLVLARISEKNPWPVEIQEIVLRANHEAVGMQLAELKLRTITGATVVALTRGGLSVHGLSPELQFFPGDHVVLMGTNVQIERAKEILLKETEDGPKKRDGSQFDVLSFCVGSDANFVGKILSSLNLRRSYGVNVVGIQRNKEKIIDVKPDVEFLTDDILLIAGPKSAIRNFKEKFVIK